MRHYVYCVTSTSGKYYIGRHSTKNLDDGYVGSGKWVRSLKDTTGLTKKIIEECSSFEDLLKREKFYIEQYIGQANCMNFNNNPVGFASGNLNPNSASSAKVRLRDRMMGDKNPAKKTDVRQKKSIAMKEYARNHPPVNKGKKASDEVCQKISEGRTGIKYSEEGKKKLSESRKKQYQNGERTIPSFEGKTHSAETKQKLRNRVFEIKVCPHCGTQAKLGGYNLWHGDRCKLKP